MAGVTGGGWLVTGVADGAGAGLADAPDFASIDRGALGVDTLGESMLAVLSTISTSWISVFSLSAGESERSLILPASRSSLTLRGSVGGRPASFLSER